MKIKAEEVKPYNNQDKKTGQVREMFNSIAPAYDFMNRAMTFGIDKYWRRIAVNKLSQYQPKRILDIATGTGDLAIRIYKALSPEKVTGIDLAQGMLDVASEKVKKLGIEKHFEFSTGDCLNLDMNDCTFDAITVAYGVRNFENLQQGYNEMHRVLDCGGVVCVVELGTPQNPIIKALYNFYSSKLIPLMGRMISKDVKAYSYLPAIIAAAHQREDMLQLMRTAGVEKCRYKEMTFGTCISYIGKKR